MLTLNEYPPDWVEIAERCKAAASWRCVRCRHPDNKPGFPRGLVPCDDLCSHERGPETYRATPGVLWSPRHPKQRVLTVHHLDGDKANCRWWNLLALCQVCHLVFQGKVKALQGYLHDHSPWFKPYAAGLYAYIHAGVEIDRVEAEENVDLWLEVGQPWLYD